MPSLLDRLRGKKNATTASVAGDTRLSAGDILNSSVRVVAGDYTEITFLQPAHSAVFTLPRERRFVGRAELLSQLRERLKRGGALSVTSLKGVAGVGKSALALKAAYAFADLFPDGRYWLDLRGRDATAAMRSFLISLGVVNPEQLKGSLEDLCALAHDALRERRVLLVLDNAESIIQANKAHLELMMLPPPGVTLITSRAQVGADDVRVDVLSETDGLELLALNGVDTTAERDDARRIVARLGHLALALDITSRRMAIGKQRQTCAEALAELDVARSLVSQLRLPRKNSPDDNAAESFAISYELLDDALRLAFHALGMCALSGAPASGIASMLASTGDVSAAQAEECLLALDALSLLDYDRTTGRCELHPLIHDYALAQAEANAEQCGALAAAHAAHFGSEIGGSYQRAVNDGKDSTPALLTIDAELDNVMLAQTRALEPDFPLAELAVNLTDDLCQYWRLRDESQLEAWLNRALELARLNGYTQRQANVLKAIGDVQSFRDDRDAALKSYDEALGLFKQVGAKLGQANVYLGLGKLSGDGQWFEQAISIHEQIQSRYDVGVDKYYYAIACLQKNESDRAIMLLGETRALWEQSNFDYGIQAVDGLLRQIRGES